MRSLIFLFFGLLGSFGCTDQPVYPDDLHQINFDVDSGTIQTDTDISNRVLSEDSDPDVGRGSTHPNQCLPPIVEEGECPLGFENPQRLSEREDKLVFVCDSSCPKNFELKIPVDIPDANGFHVRITVDVINDDPLRGYEIYLIPRDKDRIFYQEKEMFPPGVEYPPTNIMEIGFQPDHPSSEVFYDLKIFANDPSEYLDQVTIFWKWCELPNPNMGYPYSSGEIYRTTLDHHCEQE